ncbi:MAG: CBS domain-containing protein, partial [Deltaproteobacteria bacterium]|nr:CBS domain-containing protein [Deltaproteobacteria bacterium]
LMSTDFVEIAATASVADAIAAVRQWADEVAMLHYVYLLDDTGTLVGAVSLKQLILARPDTPLRELAGMRLVTVSADEDWSDVAEKFYKYNFQALPVVDENDRLVGVVSFRSSFDELVRYYVREAA